MLLERDRIQVDILCCTESIMAVDKIDLLNDPRVEQRTAYINGKTYGMETAPSCRNKAEDIAFADENCMVLQAICTVNPSRGRFGGPFFWFVSL